MLYLIGWLWGATGMIRADCLAHCLAYSKDPERVWRSLGPGRSPPTPDRACDSLWISNTMCTSDVGNFVGKKSFLDYLPSPLLHRADRSLGPPVTAMS